jgi:hypothetical protein
MGEEEGEGRRRREQKAWERCGPALVQSLLMWGCCHDDSSAALDPLMAGLYRGTSAQTSRAPRPRLALASRQARNKLGVGAVRRLPAP